MPNEKLAHISTVGMILKPQSPEIKPEYERIRKIFADRGIEVLLAERSAEMIGERGMDFDGMCQAADFLISLGGDGTLLSLVRRSYGTGKPVLGINAGNLGFLADVRLDEVEAFIDRLLAGDYRIDDRMMIEGYVQRADGKQEPFFALNDVVITSPKPSKMVQVNASIDGERFNSYRGDGLIISTPTGSTAYNLAAGGPVIYPLTKAFIITPVLAHSLTNQRPLVVPADFSIGLDTEKYDAIAVVDGQDEYVLGEEDMVYIMGAKVGARLIHRSERNYFAILRDKLHWGEKLW
jgi:NAD+ kinase